MGTTTDKLNKLIETKNAIRTSITNKGGGLTESDKFSDYAVAIDTIQIGGEDTRFKDLVEGTITEINDRTITLIDSYAFCSCKKLTNVSFPLATSIGDDAFYLCSSLTSVSFPSVTSIGENAFRSCSSLTSVDFPLVTSIGSYVFTSCGKLTSASFPLATSISSWAFQYCSSLASVSFPSATTIGYEALWSCSSLTSVSFPLVTSIGSYSLGWCSSLTSIDFPLVTSISGGAFKNCGSLIKLIIRQTDKVCTLSSKDAFDSCYHILGTTDSTYNPNGDKDGIIYVPDELVDSYKTATNWSVFADIIKPLSLENGDHISNLVINNSKLSLTTPRNAVIYLDGFTNTPDININVSNESIAQVNNITTTTEKITFEVIALGEEGNATITVNVSGDYSKTLTIEVSYIAPIEYRIEQISEAAYGFTLNSNEYYESTNKGKASSYSLCKLVFNATEKNNILKLECINSGESSYDFGILSNIDTTLSLNSNSDSTNVYKSFNGQSSTSPVSIIYPEATVGEHYIYIKYIKDGSSDTGNDSLQFRVTA